MRRTLLATAFVFLVGVLPAAANPIAITYTFTGSPGDQASEPVDSNPPGVTASDITRGPGLSPASGLNSINSDAWNSVFDPTDFYTFTITPDIEMDLNRLEFTAQSSTTGPSALQLRSSLDGFSAPISTFLFAGFNDELRFGISLSLLSTAFDNLTTAVTFRILAYRATSGAGTFRLGTDGVSTEPANLQILGDAVVPVPEPATMALLTLGLAGVGTRRWRRRRA